MVAYTEDQLEQMGVEYGKLLNEYYSHLQKFNLLNLSSQRAREFALHGFGRRLGVLYRAIENVYTLCPPSTKERLDRDTILDVTINIQAIYFNAYGCLDNLAWIWVRETNLKDKKDKDLSQAHVSLLNKTVKSSFSKEFQKLLGQFEEWIKNLQDYRHALAHRIPFYIPPYMLTPEEAERENQLNIQRIEKISLHDFEAAEQIGKELERIGRPVFTMEHSFSEESRPLAFHPQIICDWRTVLAIADEFLKELERFKSS